METRMKNKKKEIVTATIQRIKDITGADKVLQLGAWHFKAGDSVFELEKIGKNYTLHRLYKDETQDYFSI